MARGAFTVEQVAGDTTNANPVSCFIVQKYLFVGYDNDEPICYSAIKTIEKLSDRKSSVTNLYANSKWGVLLALRDNGIAIHSLGNMSFVGTLPKSKGCTVFGVALDQQIILAAVKRNLLVYKWDNGKPQLFKETQLMHTPKHFTCFSDRACIAFKTNYTILDLNTFQITKDLFDISGAQLPQSIDVQPGREFPDARSELCLLRGDNGYFVDYDGLPTRKTGEYLEYGSVPSIIMCYYPYIIAITAQGLTIIHNLLTCSIIQAFGINGKTLTIGSFEYSSDDIQKVAVIISREGVYELRLLPWLDQVDAMCCHRPPLYEEALMICKVAKNDIPEDQVKGIHSLYGYYLFSEGKYRDATRQFEEAEEDPIRVIEMIPDLCPSYHKAVPTDHDLVEPLEGEAKLKAIKTMIPYLNGIREDFPPEEEMTEKQKEDIKFIDTSLFRAYLIANKQLLLNFFNQKNHCDFKEAETLLEENKLWDELQAVYKSKGLHRKALDIISNPDNIISASITSTYSSSSSSSGKTVEDSAKKSAKQTARYLKELGQKDEELIMEYSRNILLKYPDIGLTIFTEESPQANDKPIDPQHILTHLKAVYAGHNKNVPIWIQNLLPIEYLKFIIHYKNDNTPQFHTELIYLYLESILPLQAQPEEEAKVLEKMKKNQILRGGEEGGLLGALHAELLEFLKSSHYYSAEQILKRLPPGQLLEERAIILTRMGQHEKALYIHVHKLGDYEMAEDYCSRFYDGRDPNTRDIYISLIRAFLRPPPMSADRVQKFLESAIGVLERHYHQMDIEKALALFPPSIPLKKLEPYIESVFRGATELRRQNQVSKQLSKYERDSVDLELIQAQKRHIRITSSTLCMVCHRAIGNSAFALYPNDTIVHFSCCTDKKVCPITRAKFS